jgi:trimeric autotransporter adhesin
MLDLTTNQMLSLPINDRVRNAGPSSGITRLDSDSERFYGVGWHYGKGGTTEGSFAGSWSDGSLVWIEDCHGDTYDIHATPGAVYTASHKHYCGNSGGFPQTTPWTYYHSMASTNDVRGVNTPDIYGYPDHPGTPRPEFLNWFPTTAVGTYTGQDQAAWTVTGNDEYVVYGGEFPRVNGTAQEGLVRYTLRSSAPNKRGPVLQGAAINPNVRSLVPGSVRITMPGNHDQDDSLLTYRLHRGTQGTVVHEFQANARFWERKPTVWTDTDVQPGQQLRYRLEVVDPRGNIARSDWVSVTVATEDTLGAYGAAVLGDGAQKYWRLGESTTDVVDWAGADDTVAGAGVTRGTAGALIDQPDTASRFSGSNDGRVISRELVQGPDTFSLEVWFKTTTTNGGKIAGFGNRASGDSGSYDRHIYLDRQGRLVFGVYPGLRGRFAAPWPSTTAPGTRP